MNPGSAWGEPVVPHLGALDHQRVAVLDQLVDGGRDALQGLERELGADGLGPDGGGLREGHVLVDAVVGAARGHRGEVEAVEIGEEAVEVLGVGVMGGTARAAQGPGAGTRWLSPPSRCTRPARMLRTADAGARRPWPKGGGRSRPRAGIDPRELVPDRTRTTR